MANDTHTETQSHPNLSTEPGHKGPAATGGTDTQDSLNISTEHQQEGDARAPSDTLDRGQDETPGGQDAEDVADRPSVGSVSPEDYPKDEPDH